MSVEVRGKRNKANRKPLIKFQVKRLESCKVDLFVKSGIDLIYYQ